MGSLVSSVVTQTFPPKPTFTEDHVPDLAGKVYIVSGSNTGVGKELARILHSKNAKVYLAARTESKTLQAIEDIRKANPTSTGELAFLKLDLADLSTIKGTVREFTDKEPKLHVLFNNAGVMGEGTRKTAQGYEEHLGVNCIGTFLFTKLLTPTLAATAKVEPPGTVRAVWVASMATELFAVKRVGMPLDNLDYHVDKSGQVKYWVSKVGSWAYGAEYARRHREDGIVSVSLNPGMLASDLYREQKGLFKYLTLKMCYPVGTGAYTELFAGLSSEVTLERSGDWVIPFGRFRPIRSDLVAATKTEAEGGTGGNAKFWEWTEEQVKPFI